VFRLTSSGDVLSRRCGWPLLLSQDGFQHQNRTKLPRFWRRVKRFQFGFQELGRFVISALFGVPPGNPPPCSPGQESFVYGVGQSDFSTFCEFGKCIDRRIVFTRPLETYAAMEAKFPFPIRVLLSGYSVLKYVLHQNGSRSGDRCDGEARTGPAGILIWQRSGNTRLERRGIPCR
jgi:hypothetical protein